MIENSQIFVIKAVNHLLHHEKCRICVRCHTAFDVKIIDVFGIQSILGITADQNWKERYLPNKKCDFGSYAPQLLNIIDLFPLHIVSYRIFIL